MYQVDSKDVVVKLAHVPQSSVGAPLPLVLSNEGAVILSYCLQDIPENWDASDVRVISQKSEKRLAIVEFKLCYAHMFGPPNDEAFQGHPLASRGLGPYGAFEVLNSSWLRRLQSMNSVHQYHKPERFWERHHFVFSFHDSTFECIAVGFEVNETYGSMRSVIPVMAEKLWTR